MEIDKENSNKIIIKKPVYLRDSYLYTIKKWRDVLKGHPCFVLGNGPSLNDYKDLRMLDGLFTIGINRSFKIIDPIILFWQDVSLWNDHWKDIMECQAIKVSRASSDPYDIAARYNLYSGSPQLTKRPDRLYGMGNSGMLAFQLAYSMGCSPIVLLGMDCKTDDKGNTDFYGVNKYHTVRTMSNCEKSLKWIFSNKDRISIHNCSNNIFGPREDINDVIAELNCERKDRNFFKKILR